MTYDHERSDEGRPPRTHDGSVESFSRRAAERRRLRDPEAERRKITTGARWLRVFQWIVAGGLGSGALYVAWALWERDRVLPAVGLVVMTAIAIVRIFRGSMT